MKRILQIAFSKSSNNAINYKIPTQVSKVRLFSGLNDLIQPKIFSNVLLFAKKNFIIEQRRQFSIEKPKYYAKILEIGSLVEQNTKLQLEEKFEEATKLIEKVFTYEEEQPFPKRLKAHLHTVQGINYQALGENAKARLQFLDSVKNEQSAENYVLLADCNRALSLLDEAEDAYLKAFEIDSTLVGLCYNYGTFLEESRKTGEAIPYFRHEIQNFERRDKEDMEILANSYIKLSNSLMNFHGDAIVLKIYQASFDEAVECLVKAVSVSSEFKNHCAQLLWNIVDLTFRAKTYNLGVSTIEKMILLDMFSEEYKDYLPEVTNIVRDFKAGKTMSTTQIPEIKFEASEEEYDDEDVN